MSNKEGESSPTRRSEKGLYVPPVRRRQMLAAQETIKKQKQKRLPEIKTADDDADSSKGAELSLRPSVCSFKQGSKVTNLDRFMESVTPYVSARSLSEVNAREYRTDGSNLHSYFCLADLWEYFNERSAYGTAVPLLLNGKDPVEQYYVPYLSGMQLYIDSSRPSLRPHEEKHDELHRLRNVSGNGNSVADRIAKYDLISNTQLMENLSPGDVSDVGSKVDTTNAQEPILFQFFEHEPPYVRRPLIDKVSFLASQNPELKSCKSCDLLPTSWICVAWYPIYRIPVGPTLKDLEACFLTFHSLSTQSKCKFPPKLHAPNTRRNYGVVESASMISLPVFGLASYKLKGSILSPQESEQEDSLLQSANDWLQQLKVMLPDYQFFRNHYYNGR